MKSSSKPVVFIEADKKIIIGYAPYSVTLTMQRTPLKVILLIQYSYTSHFSVSLNVSLNSEALRGIEDAG